MAPSPSGERSLEEWLAGIGLAEHAASIAEQGYSSLRFVRAASREDIEELSSDLQLSAEHAERLAQAEYNVKRVSYRNELEERKRVERAEQLEHERILGEEQVLRLQKVREQVLERLNVQCDAERAAGPTVASSATAQAREELFPVYGYADDTLMKDMRFKIGHALRNAGLNGTKYASDLMKSDRWGGPSRPDAVVTNFSLGYDAAA